MSVLEELLDHGDWGDYTAMMAGLRRWAHWPLFRAALAGMDRTDSLDDDHGRRSSHQLARLTGRSGDELQMLMAAVEAHSRDDRDMTEIIRSHHPADYLRARRLAEMLKDSDGLDRVRIHQALDPSYLRRRCSRFCVAFSQFLFSLYGQPLHHF